MRYFYFIFLLLINSLIFTQTAFANVDITVTGRDRAVSPAPISCYGELTSQQTLTSNFIKCRWFLTIENPGPDNATDFNISDSFYPASSNTVGPSFQGPSSGRFQSLLYETYLKIEVPIDHVIRVESYGDPDCSNNQYVESFIISPSGAVTPAVPENNYYNNCYDNGYNKRYNNGYSAPWPDYNNGYNNNYNNGYNNGVNNGFNSHFNNGYNIGTSVARAVFPPTVDLFQLTSSGQREDWPVIHKNTVCWLGPQGIYCYDISTNTEFPLFGNEQPLTDLFGLVGLDQRFIIYNRFSDQNSYDVGVYDLKKKEEVFVTSEVGSQWADDYDHNTLVYIDGGACGKLYSYNLLNRKKTLITETACGPARISGNIVVWAYAAPRGTNIYGYDLQRNRQFDIATGNGIQESPDIFNNTVVWTHYGDGTDAFAVYLKDLHRDTETLLDSSTEYSMSWPSISKKYVVWGKNTSQHVAGVEGYNLKTHEVFEIHEQGPHQNGNISPIIEGNIAAWMAWRTGNGDIYGAEIN